MKAVNHYIIIDPIKNEPKKVGGLILTDEVNEDNRYLKAKVVSVGNLVAVSYTHLTLPTNREV